MENRSVRECIELSLEKNENGESRKQLLCDALVQKGISGDARAFEIICRILGDDEGSVTVAMEGGADELAE